MNRNPSTSPPGLAKWRQVPLILMGAGGALCLLGYFINPKQFAFAWLVAFMFFLSLGLGALFLVIVHHLFDAGWSVPIRRFCEHIASLLFPWMAIFFLPIAFLAKIHVLVDDPKAGLRPFAGRQAASFHGADVLCRGRPLLWVWWLLSNRLRYWSLEQDRTGGARPTYRMRAYSACGIFLFAVTLTLAAIMWIKALQYQWFSTMYGVYYFAGSVWLALATAYIITVVLDRQGVLREVLHEQQYYFLGSLLFAFTVFYAYIHLSQYFIIWNGNMPEETFWYVVREKGSWWDVGLVIIFGHFFLPFLALLRIDVRACLQADDSPLPLDRPHALD